MKSGMVILGGARFCAKKYSSRVFPLEKFRAYSPPPNLPSSPLRDPSLSRSTEVGGRSADSLLTALYRFGKDGESAELIDNSNYVEILRKIEERIFAFQPDNLFKLLIFFAKNPMRPPLVISILEQIVDPLPLDDISPLTHYNVPTVGKFINNQEGKSHNNHADNVQTPDINPEKNHPEYGQKTKCDQKPQKLTKYTNPHFAIIPLLLSSSNTPHNHLTLKFLDIYSQELAIRLKESVFEMEHCGRVFLGFSNLGYRNLYILDMLSETVCDMLGEIGSKIDQKHGLAPGEIMSGDKKDDKINQKMDKTDKSNAQNIPKLCDNMEKAASAKLLTAILLSAATLALPNTRLFYTLFPSLKNSIQWASPSDLASICLALATLEPLPYISIPLHFLKIVEGEVSRRRFEFEASDGLEVCWALEVLGFEHISKLEIIVINKLFGNINNNVNINQILNLLTVDQINQFYQLSISAHISQSTDRKRFAFLPDLEQRDIAEHLLGDGSPNPLAVPIESQVYEMVRNWGVVERGPSEFESFYRGNVKIGEICEGEILADFREFLDIYLKKGTDTLGADNSERDNLKGEGTCSEADDEEFLNKLQKINWKKIKIWIDIDFETYPHLPSPFEPYLNLRRRHLTRSGYTLVRVSGMEWGDSEDKKTIFFKAFVRALEELI